MASQMAILTRTRILTKAAAAATVSDSNPFFKSITTSTFLSQEPQLAESTYSQPASPSASTPLPPNPASGSPLYNENWRSPIPNSSLTQSLIPMGFLHQSQTARIHALSQTLDVQSLMNVFADWMTSQRWTDMKQLFEFWTRSLDKTGKPNKPDVNLYNHYLRANLMTNATAADLLDLVAQMEDYAILPNTASFNLVLKSMYNAKETAAATKLLERLAVQSLYLFTLYSFHVQLRVKRHL